MPYKMTGYQKGGEIMRDFPMFTTENGVGSLVLKEIPYSGIAYVTIHDSSFPTNFLKECADFCRAAGAEKIYASGHQVLDAYPFHTAIIQMAASVHGIPQTDACLFPVTEKTLQRWRQIYNEKMNGVANAAYLSESATQELLRRGDAYFVHRNGTLLGIGIAANDCIDCVASVQPGGGREVVAALAHGLARERVVLDVASTNTKAIRLYESMGFIKIAERSRWYQIF